MKKISIIINVILGVAVAVLYVLHFTDTSAPSGSEDHAESTITADPDSSANNSQVPEGVNIVFINTDSVWRNYTYVEDVNNELLTAKKKMESQFQRKMNLMEQEQKAFVQKVQANAISLEQAQQQERELLIKQQELLSLEQKDQAELDKKQQSKTQEIHAAIQEYLKDYNKEHGYDFILGQSFGNLPLANETLDITNIVIKNLNEEYARQQEQNTESN